MKVKEILNLEDSELEKMMTEEEYFRMKNLGMQYVWQLLDAMKDGARQSDMNEDEEYTTVSEYLNYLEEMKSDTDV